MTPPRFEAGHRRCSCGPASAPSRSPRPREARRYFEQAATLSDEPSRARRAPRSFGPDGCAHGGSRLGAAPLRTVDRVVRRRRRHACGCRAVHVRLGRLDARTGRRDEAMLRLENALRGHLAATSPTKILRCSQRPYRSGTGTAATSSGPRNGRSLPSTSQRHMPIPPPWRLRCAQRRRSSAVVGTIRNHRAFRSTPSALRSSTTSSRTRASATSSSPTPASTATSTPAPSTTSTTRSR